MKALAIGIALSAGFAPSAFSAEPRASTPYDAVIAKHAQANGVPETLVRRVIQRESKFNPSARNGPYLGMMQISAATARIMGYRGAPTGLLDADVNLTYAVRYLAGAYKTAGGDHDRTMRFYARGYYYDAKRKGLLATIGLGRSGRFTLPPTPPQVAGVTTVAAAVPTPPMRGAGPASAAPAPTLASVAVVPVPPARGAAPARPATAGNAPRLIDPRTGPALAASISADQPLTTGSVTARPSAPLPPARPGASPQAAAIPTPPQRDMVVALPPHATARPARTLAADPAPALAYAGEVAHTPQLRGPIAPLPPRR